MGSACRCTTFQVPSSGRKMLVTRRATGAGSSLGPTLASRVNSYQWPLRTADRSAEGVDIVATTDPSVVQRAVG